MQIERPVLPLTPAQFTAALHRGHGRAVQQINDHGAVGLEDRIIEACVSCVTYDPQCEADRSPWLYSIVDRAKLNESVLQAIEATIKEPPPEDHRDIDQRSAILKELAAAGSIDARRLLYASLVRLSHTSDVIGADQIVELDGVDGLIYAARQLGRWLHDDPHFWVDDYLSSQVDRSLGIEGAGIAALERAAVADPDVARYLTGLRKTQASQSSHGGVIDVEAYTGAEIVAHVNNNPKDQCHWFRRWGGQATLDQRELVFEAMLASEEPGHVMRLSRCFAKTGVPRFDRRLLRWIAHVDERVRRAVVKAAAPIKHVELRQAAMHLFAEGDAANGMALLVNNFEADDFALGSKSLERIEDADEAHDLVRSLLDLCEAHPGANALDCLLHVYELSPCSACRHTAVKALVDTNTAPAWVLAECTFDADPDTRAFAGIDGLAN